MHNNPLYISGVTPQGEVLLAGLYRLKDERGFPVDMAYEICKENRMCPDWCEFLADAGRQTDWKFDDAVEEMKLLVGEHLGEEILYRFKVLGASMLKTMQDADFITICEEIVRRKQACQLTLSETFTAAE